MRPDPTPPRKPLVIGTLRVLTVELPSGMVVENITRRIEDEGEGLYLSAQKMKNGKTSTSRIDSDWRTPLPRDATYPVAAATRAQVRAIASYDPRTGLLRRIAERASGGVVTKLTRVGG